VSLRRDDFVSHEAQNYVEIGPQEELRVFPDGGRHIIERDLRDHAASCMGGGTADRPDRRSMRQTNLVELQSSVCAENKWKSAHPCGVRGRELHEMRGSFEGAI
jgi:hypothetical protein